MTPRAVSGVSSWMLTTALEMITCPAWPRATMSSAGEAVGRAVARVANTAKAEEKIADFILMFGLVWFLDWEVGIKRGI